MAYTDFIAAIDLGSSHMVGMVGAKGPAGTLSIIAYRQPVTKLEIEKIRGVKSDHATKWRTPIPVYEEDVYII